ncbi:Hypothetical predicted protein, partial [Marmota monax]
MGVGSKEVRKEPNCIPYAHLGAPSSGSDSADGRLPGNSVPLRGTLAARRGGKDADSGPSAAGTTEKRRAQQSHSHYLQRSHPSPTPAAPRPSPPPKETSNPEHVPCPLSGEEVGRKRNESFLEINETFAPKGGGTGNGRRWEGALKAPGWAEAANLDQPSRRRTADSSGHQPRLTKGSGAARPGQKGKERPPRGPIRSAATMASFTRRLGAPPRLPARRGRRSPPPPRREPSPGRRRCPRAPRSVLRSAPGARPAAAAAVAGARGAGRSRRGWSADAELCAGKRKDARGPREEGGDRGGRGSAAAAGEAGARGGWRAEPQAGGRRGRGLLEPLQLRSRSRNPARRSGSPAPARRLPLPGRPGPVRQRLLAPAPTGGRKPRTDSCSPKEAAAAAPPPVRADPESPSRRVGLCVCECAALSPHAWHMRK